MSARARIARRVWTKAAVALAIIWTIAATVVIMVRPVRQTASSVIAYLREQNLANLAANEREEVMREAAKRLNALAYPELRQLRASRALFAFYRPLHPLEKERFAAMIIPAGFARILDASRDVPAQDRARFLESALYYAVIDLSTANPPINPEALERIEREALESYERSLSVSERKAMEPQLQQVREYLYPKK